MLFVVCLRFHSRLVKIGIVRPTPFAFVNSILGMLADQLLDWCTLEFLWHACGISILLTEKGLLCTYYVQKVHVHSSGCVPAQLMWPLC